MRGSRIKAAVSAVGLFFLCIGGAVTMLVAKLLHLGLTETFPLVFHALVCRLFNLQCEVVGVPSTDRPTLFVSNHVSYLDVFVLGSLMKGSFVAKSEVANWPVFGSLARLQNTLFLERKRGKAVENIQIVSNHLKTTGNLIMFPEGTSTSGTFVAPFRSSLFAAADDVTIQPVTVAYVGYEGHSMTAEERERYAWYLPDPKAAPTTPNSPFVSHFFTGMGLGRCRVKILFHEPLAMGGQTRKQRALECEHAVRRGLVQLLESETPDIATPELTTAT